jgi:hypothetical protein
LGSSVATDDDRVRLHSPEDARRLAGGVGGLDLVVLDDQLATPDLVGTLEAARDHAAGEREMPPVVVYRGTEDIREAAAQILPDAALVVLDAWERAVVPGLGGLVVLVEPSRLTSHPRLRHLLRHYQTPAYVNQRVLAVDLARRVAPQPDAEPAPAGLGAALTRAEASAAGAIEQARLSARSAEELRAALSAAHGRLLELTSEVQQASRESAVLRARLEEARPSSPSLDTRLAAEKAERRKLEESLVTARDREAQLLGHVRELEDIMVECSQAEARRARVVNHLQAVAGSTTWRWGHRIAMMFRRLTFRRPMGPSALDRALELAREPILRGPGDVDVRK